MKLMKSVGLITEYNPMHNGHILHLKEAMKVAKADVSIVVMSGNFVQRGEPAMIDKYARAEACIRSGASLVVELPAYYALSSAEGFAAGAVRTLHALGADSLVFGSESANLDLFRAIASILYDEPAFYREALKKELAKGNSFPMARQSAVLQYLAQNSSLSSCDVQGQDTSQQSESSSSQIGSTGFTEEELTQALSSPNNILGIEYLKAIHHYAKEIKPHTIIRKGSGYHETEISEGIPSATAIRAMLTSKENAASITETEIFDDLSALIPSAMLEIMKEQYQHTFPITPDDFSMLLNYRLEQIFHAHDYNKSECCLELSSYYDLPTDLANRITQLFDPTLSLSEFASKLKTRQYTYSRIMRCLFHIILDMKKVNYTRYTTEQVPYIRILGFDTNGQKYLGHIRKKCEVPIITKTADYKDLLQDDIFITNVYNQVVFQKYHCAVPDEYHRGIFRFAKGNPADSDKECDP